MMPAATPRYDGAPPPAKPLRVMTGVQTMRLRGLPSGIIYLISPVMTRSGLAGTWPGIGRVRHPLTLP